MDKMILENTNLYNDVIGIIKDYIQQTQKHWKDQMYEVISEYLYSTYACYPHSSAEEKFLCRGCTYFRKSKKGIIAREEYNNLSKIITAI